MFVLWALKHLQGYSVFLLASLGFDCNGLNQMGNKESWLYIRTHYS